MIISVGKNIGFIHYSMLKIRHAEKVRIFAGEIQVTEIGL